MGYTHYFPHTECTEEAWHNIIEDCTKLFDNRPKGLIRLRHYNGQGDYHDEMTSFAQCVGEGELAFNGHPGVMAHETFALYQGGSDGFAFTKTARKYYDLMVCGCLIAYHFHSAETIEISSDGEWDDWGDAMALVIETLGAKYVMKFKMSNSRDDEQVRI